MLRRLALLGALLLLYAVPCLADPPARPPSDLGGGAGGDAAMFAVCAAGGKGIAHDAASNTWGAVCGNYNWSAEKGGTDAAGVGDFHNLPTTVGGNRELIACTGDLAGTHPTLGAIVEPACRQAGQIVYRNATADLVIASWLARNPDRGCDIYVPNLAPSNATSYTMRGCGDKHTGTNNKCPVPPPPYNTFPQRLYTVHHGIRLCGEGMDRDGQLEPPLGELGGTTPPMTGVYLVHDQGLQGLSDEDPNDDGNLDALAEAPILVGGGGGNKNTCVPVSDSDMRCNALHSSRRNVAGVPGTPWGAASLSSLADSDATTGEWCIDNNAAASGTCRGGRQYACSVAGSDLAPSAGGCDPTGAPDLDPCEGLADAINYELNTRRRPLYAAVNTQAPNWTETIWNAGGMGVIAPLNANSSLAACGAGGKRMGFYTSELPQTSSLFELHESSALSQFSLPATYSESTASFEHFYVYDEATFNNQDGGLQGVTLTTQEYVGRLAPDDQDTTSNGLVATLGPVECDGAGTISVTVGGSPGWAADAWNGMSFVLRPGLATQEIRKIRDVCNGNQLDYQAAFAVAPSVGDAFRISRHSCFGGSDTYLQHAENACDGVWSIRGQVGIGGDIGPIVMDRSGTIDAGNPNPTLWVHDSVIQNYVGLHFFDVPGLIFERVLFRNNKSARTFIASSFIGRTQFRDVAFHNNRVSELLSNGRGHHFSIQGAEFIGNRCGPFIDRMNAAIYLIVSASGSSLIEDVSFVGNECSFMTIRIPTNETYWGPTIRHVRAVGKGNLQTGLLYGYALINLISDDGGASGRLRSLLFDDIRQTISIPTASLQPCLIYLDNGVEAGNRLDEDAQNITVTNSSIDNITASGVPDENTNRVFCVADFSVAGIKTRADDLGVLTLDGPPILIGNSTNGFPQPTQPYHYGAAADLPTCVNDQSTGPTTVGEGTVVGINNDDGSCLDTVAGTLTGGGTVAIPCKCVTGPAWVPL